MASDTQKNYRNQVIYSVFVRNYSAEGTFDAVRRDLDRIRALGVDIIWLLPIHPIGEVARKGTLGSPYAIRDYRTVNPEFGTIADFCRLVDGIHDRGMKCIIDVVYNHTSPDSWLCRIHPEWFYHKPDGSFGNRIGDWTDVVDLDYRHMELWDYQIETLKMWAELVDGFRCDVAPLVPLEFWRRARREVAQVRPDCFWLAESVEPDFIVYNRSRGLTALSDSELYQAFDACYDYDTYDIFRDGLQGKRPLKEYADACNRQEAIYPENYVKLRFLENHDRPRISQCVGNGRILRNWTAFLYFQKGITLLYAGQEAAVAHLPSLFDRDPVEWNTGVDLSPLLRTLAQIKRDALFAEGTFHVTAQPGDVLVAVWEAGERKAVGIFCIRGSEMLVDVPLAGGTYENLLGGTVEVHEGRLCAQGEPILVMQ